MLFEPLCISMFLPVIENKIKEIKKSNAHHINVAYKIVGLSIVGLAIRSHFHYVTIFSCQKKGVNLYLINFESHSPKDWLIDRLIG